MGLTQDTLTGKVAMITGAGRGIGKELARALAWLGAKVVIAEISDVGATVANQINLQGGEAYFIQTNVGNEDKHDPTLSPAILAELLHGVLSDVNHETNELDIFRKKWVTRTFRQRCGMSIQDWLETSSDLVEQCKQIEKEYLDTSSLDINHE